jgi:ribosomal protein S9
LSDDADQSSESPGVDKAIPKDRALLKITEGTVKVHIGYVLKKLGASGRVEAVRIALERGIVHLT